MSSVHDSVVIQTSFCDRLRVSWRSYFSVRVRYELASLIAITGLILTLCALAAVYASCYSCVISFMFIEQCLSLGCSPFPLSIFSLVIGVSVLFFGIYLLPQHRVTLY